MIEGRASRTAEETTIGRVIESIAPEDKRVCYDPLALEFLAEKQRASYRNIQKSKFLTKLSLWSNHRDPSGTKAELVARTRYFDDYLQSCISDGVEQVVILGAGNDSRAYRFKGLEEIKVFEVDHPPTQKRKVANVKRVLGDLPRWVTYVPIDFEKENLAEKLPASGYKRDLRTLFIWEGVTMYLTAEAVDRTLSFVAGTSGRGSTIIFNYWHRSAVDGTSRWRWAKSLRRKCQKMGEPVTFGMEPDSIEEFLVMRGFSHVKRVTPSFLTSLYFRGPNAKRKVCPFIEIVHATVRAVG